MRQDSDSVAHSPDRTVTSRLGNGSRNDSARRRSVATWSALSGHADPRAGLGARFPGHLGRGVCSLPLSSAAVSHVLFIDNESSRRPTGGVNETPALSGPSGDRPSAKIPPRGGVAVSSARCARLSAFISPLDVGTRTGPPPRPGHRRSRSGCGCGDDIFITAAVPGTLAASAASRGSALSTTTSSTSAIASNSSMISTQAPASPIRPAGGTISAKRQGAPGSDFSIAIDPS
jgi:hypothetical protein